jgi:ribosomal protein S6--L-glutamate ligase
VAAPGLLLLSRQPDGHAVTRLVESAAARAIPLRVLDPHTLQLDVLHGKAAARVADGTFLDHAAVRVLPRIGSSSTEYSLAALEHLELAGCATLNPSAGLHRLRHKFLALGYLAAAGVPVPDSIVLRSPADTAPAVEALGGYPVIVKFIRGSQGLGVVYADNPSVVQSVLEALNFVQYDVLLQRYLPQAAESDLRVLVLGGRARWAMRRSSVGGFRSNIHRGGTAVAVDFDSAAAARCAVVAEQAAAAFGLGLAGVDIVEGEQPLVLEVNSRPGFEMLEEVTGADIAGEIVLTASDLPARLHL